MSLADEIFIKNVQDILENGVSDADMPVRPHWDDGTPAQNTIVTRIQGAMLKFQHGIKSMDVEAIIDDYIEDGHTMMDILKNVIYPLMYDAGFFTKAMMEEMFKAMDNLDTEL